MSNTHTITDYKFFLAPKPGKSCTFTISSPTKHFTFKISASKSLNDNGKVLFLKVLTGPDNESSYSYVGILRQNVDFRPAIVPTRKSKVGMDAQSVKALLWVLRQIYFNKELPEGYDVLHSGHCAACGRKLTTPESIEMGLGPICAGN